MVIRRIAPLSLAKMLASLYACLGLLVGAALSSFALLGVALAANAPRLPRFFGLLVGAGAVIALPLFYGLLGFVVGGLVAVLYNGLAGVLGGIEIET